ncbi:MAG TPA: S16 family serine protease [Propionibacteriaceae bacterium]|nr:S16 family serine protease [Propionibacteriaceae bacterium]
MGRVTKQTWTAIVSAVLFVSLAALIAISPVPYVAWGPGSTLDVMGTFDDQPAISVSGLTIYPVSGELRMTTVSVTRADSRMSLPEAHVNYWAPHRDVLPRDAVYPKGKSVESIRDEEIRMMDTSQSDAIVAALRAAGQPVTEMPMVESVLIAGPASEKLEPGDLIAKIDAVAVQSSDDVRRAIRLHAVGEPVVVTVIRNDMSINETIVTVSSNEDAKIPVIGVNVGTGYRYTPRVTFGIDPQIVGPSAGLIFSLGIFNLIDPGDLMAGRKVAGTGEISAEGVVKPIGGLQEKIRGAELAGSEVFLIPADNCRDLEGLQSPMTLVKVATLQDAIGALESLQQPEGSQEVPQC